MSSRAAAPATVTYTTNDDTTAAATAATEGEGEVEGQDEGEDEDEDEDEVARIPARPVRVNATMITLSALPPARNPVTHPGRITRLNRCANVEANLAQIAGHVNVPECAYCARGNGVFVMCVSVPGQLSGSCANCHYNNGGVRCSLRPRAAAVAAAAAIAAADAPFPYPPFPYPARRPRSWIAPTLVSGPRNIAPAAPAISDSRGGPVARAGGFVGPVRVPRWSRAERMRAIAAAQQQLVELYAEEEAERLEEARDVEEFSFYNN